MTLTVEDISTGTDHERVVFCRDPEAGYRAVIAVHSTVAGPSAGGVRFWTYSSEAEAIQDALRLSRGMTYKNVTAGLPVGGGKSVILRDGPADRGALFRAHGRAVERLGGLYTAGEDVGTSPEDMAIMLHETRYVAGLADRSGDPSPNTARGVRRGIQAAALRRWGSDDLAGRTVALQGCGNVGFHLALELRLAGADLVVTDIDPGRVRKVVAATRARSVAPEEIYDVEADVFAPCALGGILNAETIPRLRTEIVAGAANNQLRDPGDGDRIEARGLLYAPDYVVNAGGVIGGCAEVLGWSDGEVKRRIEEIYDTLLTVLRLAAEEGISTYAAADRLAEQRLAILRAERRRG